jgi:hypothetical protein
MAPLRVGGSFATTKKQPKHPILEVEVNEVARTSILMPLAIFHRDYLPPRKDNAP